MDKIRDFKGISVEKLIEFLKQVPEDTKICIDILGDNFKVNEVKECIYHDWDDGKKGQEHKGILIG